MARGIQTFLRPGNSPGRWVTGLGLTRMVNPNNPDPNEIQVEVEMLETDTIATYRAKVRAAFVAIAIELGETLPANSIRWIDYTAG